MSQPPQPVPELFNPSCCLVPAVEDIRLGQLGTQTFDRTQAKLSCSTTARYIESRSAAPVELSAKSIHHTSCLTASARRRHRPLRCRRCLCRASAVLAALTTPSDDVPLLCSVPGDYTTAGLESVEACRARRTPRRSGR